MKSILTILPVKIDVFKIKNLLYNFEHINYIDLYETIFLKYFIDNGNLQLLKSKDSLKLYVEKLSDNDSIIFLDFGELYQENFLKYIVDEEIIEEFDDIDFIEILKGFEIPNSISVDGYYQPIEIKLLFEDHIVESRWDSDKETHLRLIGYFDKDYNLK